MLNERTVVRRFFFIFIRTFLTLPQNEKIPGKPKRNNLDPESTNNIQFP